MEREGCRKVGTGGECVHNCCLALNKLMILPYCKTKGRVHDQTYPMHEHFLLLCVKNLDFANFRSTNSDAKPVQSSSFQCAFGTEGYPQPCAILSIRTGAKISSTSGEKIWDSWVEISGSEKSNFEVVLS